MKVYKYSYVVLDTFSGCYGTLKTNIELKIGSVFKGYEIIKRGMIK